VDERAVRGVPWTLLTYAGNKLFTIATIILLARLLAPSDFGVMAIAMLMVNFFGYFGNFGLQATLVLRPALPMRAKGTLLTMMWVLGAAIAVGLAAASPLLGDLFEEPELAGVLAAMAATMVFGGPRWFYESLLQLEYEFRPRFAAQIASSAVTAGVSIGLALSGAGVWSLAGGFIAGGLVHTIALIVLAPYRVPLAFDRGHARNAIKDGSGFVAQGGLQFVQDNADYLVVSRVLGSTQLGYYSMGYRLGELPFYGIADPVAKVTFPGFSKMRHLGQDIGPAFLSTLRLVALVTVPLGVVLSAGAEPFTRALYGDKWLPMIGVLGVLGAWGMIRPTHATLGWLLNSIGAARLIGVISGITLVVLVPAIVIAANAGGITAVAGVMLADVTVTTGVLAVFASRRAGIPVRRQLETLKPALVAGPVSWIATRGVAEALSGEPPFLALAAVAVTALGSFAIVATLVAPGIVKEAMDQAGRTLGREAAADSN